ncbi:hypothetical protein KVD59_07415 [Helicobacter pylori]|nr:hypothetical protein KVD59_07415 [Helicobacter pylori]
MWHEKILKVIPAAVFLFCILEIFELALIVCNMNKIEKIEMKIKSDLEVLKTITDLLNKHFEGMDLEHFHDKKNRIK